MRIGRAGSGLFAIAAACVAALGACSTFAGDGEGGDPVVPPGGEDGGADITVGGPATGEVVLEIAKGLTFVQGQTLVVDVKVTRKPPFDKGMTILARSLPAGLAAAPVDITPLDTSAKLSFVVGKQVPQGALANVIVEARSGSTAVGETTLDAFVRGAPGDLDTTFGTNGSVAFGAGTAFDRIAMRADGSFYVLATFPPQTIRKYTKDGVLDTTFGVGGQYVPDTKIDAIAWKDPSLFLAAAQSTRWLARRLDGTKGTIDTAYGVGGTYVSDPGPTGLEVHSVAVGATGDVVIGGNYPGGALMHFLTPQGASAGSGGADTGTSPASPSYIFESLVHAGTHCIGVGRGYITRVFTQMRYLDDTFGPNGSREAAPNIALNALEIDAAGNYVLGGREIINAQGDENLFAARYKPSGSLDSTFGTGGLFRPYLPTTPDGGSIALAGDKILQVGTVLDGSIKRCMIARYTTDGKLDMSFGVAGKATPLIDDCRVGQIRTQQDGRIIVSGRHLLRFWP